MSGKFFTIDGAQVFVSERIYAHVESQLSALREKCAELKKERDSYMLLSKMRPRPFADTDAGLVAQVAELQRQLDAAIVDRDYHRDRCAARTLLELQSKLQDAERKLTTYEEAAKQEPVAYLYDGFNYLSFGKITNFGMPGSPRKIVGDPLFRNPPNLPALIEQAKREEREECAKICDRQADIASTSPGNARADACARRIRARNTGREEGKANPV